MNFPLKKKSQSAVNQVTVQIQELQDKVKRQVLGYHTFPVSLRVFLCSKKSRTDLRKKPWNKNDAPAEMHER